MWFDWGSRLFIYIYIFGYNFNNSFTKLHGDWKLQLSSGDRNDKLSLVTVLKFDDSGLDYVGWIIYILHLITLLYIIFFILLLQDDLLLLTSFKNPLWFTCLLPRISLVDFLSCVLLFNFPLPPLLFFVFPSLFTQAMKYPININNRFWFRSACTLTSVTFVLLWLECHCCKHLFVAKSFFQLVQWQSYFLFPPRYDLEVRSPPLLFEPLLYL